MAKYLENHPDFPAIVLSPLCPEDIEWDPILGKTESLLKIIEDNFPVDKNRVYLTGLSSGGAATWNLALRDSKHFAAIAPVSGYYSDISDEVPKNISTLKEVPIWVFHGAKDPTVPVSRAEVVVNALKECGANVRFTLYPEAGHDSWTETYNNPELYTWMFEQVNTRNK